MGEISLEEVERIVFDRSLGLEEGEVAEFGEERFYENKSYEGNSLNLEDAEYLAEEGVINIPEEPMEYYASQKWFFQKGREISEMNNDVEVRFSGYLNKEVDDFYITLSDFYVTNSADEFSTDVLVELANIMVADGEKSVEEDWARFWWD
jgi:hypothetical protein